MKGYGECAQTFHPEWEAKDEIGKIPWQSSLYHRQSSMRLQKTVKRLMLCLYFRKAVWKNLGATGQ